MGACKEALTSMLAVAAGTSRGAVDALRDMLVAIASEPGDVKLRVIRFGNENFQQVLGKRPGAWLFLRGVGFEPCSHESLMSSPGFAGCLGSGDTSSAASSSSEQFLALKEPNMLNDFEVWNAWHMRLKRIASFLEGLSRHVFARTAHLGRHGLDVPMLGVVTPGEVVQGWEASTDAG